MSVKETLDVVKKSKLDSGTKWKVVSLLELISKNSYEMDGFELCAARVAAGLSEKQACQMLSIDLQTLYEIEVRRTLFSPELGQKMNRVYGIGGDG